MPDCSAHPPALAISATMASLARVQQFGQLWTHAAGLTGPRADLLTVACVEVVSNVIRHARGLQDNAPIELSGQVDGDVLQLEFRYRAERYVPPCTDRPRTWPPLVAPPTANLPEGGFGLAIIAQVADTLDYRHENGVNTVQLRINRRPR